jgi:NAD(P)-dependent dehydrogenase (short-subunit alcohol dehydrogenase family)
MTQRNDKKPNSVITGGGSGIGEAFALRLATNIQVVICRQNKEKQKQEGEKSGRVSYKTVSLADYRSIDHIFAAFKAKGIVLMWFLLMRV